MGVSVLEVHSPEVITLRLVSALHSEMSGQNLRGENYIKFTPPEHQRIRGDRYQNKASVPCGSLAYQTIAQKSGREIPTTSLALPVAPTSPDQPMKIYAATDFFDNGERSKFDTMHMQPLSDEFFYLDIGNGAPE